MLSPAATAWTRFAARIIDFSLFSFLVGFVSALLFPSITNQPDAAINVEVLFLWVFVETLLLHTWGKTPGKWLLQVTVRNELDAKLSLSQAFTRSVFVFFIGMGLGLPLICLATWVFGYNELTKKGITKWDKRGNFKVTYQQNSILRIAVAVLIVLLNYGLNIYYSIVHAS